MDAATITPGFERDAQRRSMQRIVRLSDFALDYCRKNKLRPTVWYGDPQLCQDIYGAWGGTHTHPLNSIAAVLGALARSPKWKNTGYIRHLGRRYPVYEPNTDYTTTGRISKSTTP